METRFWELLVGFFGSETVAKRVSETGGGFSETQLEGVFSEISKAVSLAERFLAAKAENPLKGVFTETGVIEVTGPLGMKWRVFVEPHEKSDSTETVMVALARCGLSIKRVTVPTADEVARDNLERVKWRGIDGKDYPTEEGASATFAVRPEVLAARQVAERRANVFAHQRPDERTPTAPAPTPAKQLPDDRASACELLLRRLNLDVGEAELGAIHNALYAAWSAAYQRWRAKRRVADLEEQVKTCRVGVEMRATGDLDAGDEDELTPAPPPPPAVETQIQGAVAEESADLFNWLEKRMRLNSDKAEERTRVFTTLNRLAQRVVALCRAP